MKIGCPTFRCLCVIVVFSLAGLIAGCGGSDSDETAPSLTLASTDPSTTSRIRQLEGTVEAGAAIDVTVDTAAVVSGLEVVDGHWNCTIVGLTPGFNIVTILATDSIGNQTVLSLILLYDALSIERWVTPIPGDTVVIGGLIDPRAAEMLVVTVGAGTTTFAPVVSDDRWEVLLSGLVPGGNDVKVKITHPDIDVTIEETTLRIDVNEAAPVLTINPVAIPTALASQTVTGTRGDNLALTLLALTAEAEPLDLSVPGSWSTTLNKLQPGKNPFTVSATANAVTVTARDLIIFDPTL